MSEAAWRWMIGIACAVIAYFVLGALVSWATFVLVFVAILIGLTCAFLDVIAGSAAAVFDEL